MGYIQVRRLAVALSALLALATLGFGWLVSRSAPSPPPAGSAAEAAFGRHCAGCHDLAALRAGLRHSGDPAGDAAALATLLAGHGDAPAEEQARLVELLLGGR